jgi:transglutaminase-like putative cysteine protease
MLRLKSVLLLTAYLAVLLGVAPVYLYLDLPAQIGYPLAAAAGILGDRRHRQLLTNRFATLLSIGFFIFYALQISRDTLVEPMVNLLVLLLAVRLISDKSARHLLQIFVLALFTLAASSLLTLSMAFFAYLVLQVTLITVGLVLLTFHDRAPQLQFNRRDWRQVMGPAVLLPIGSLLLMFFFYALLPRTQHPLWQFLMPVAKAQVGLTEEMHPGSFSALAETGGIAFRTETEELDPAELYWRTIILNRTDGSSWTRQKELPLELSLPGRVVEQLIYLEPKSDRYLPALDLPQKLTGLSHQQENDLVRSSQRAINKRTRYQVSSQLNSGSRLRNGNDTAVYLQLPETLSPRLQQLAEQLRTGTTRRERIALLQQDFRDRRLEYSSSGLPVTKTPVETFLFDTRRGYCEYFASSFALLLRMAGVPTRLAGGYLGGTWNEFGGYYLISEDSAHVWVEALLEDGRWQRIDPSQLAVNAATDLFGRRQQPIGLFRQLTDSLNHLWNGAVITYDFNRQLEFLKQTNQDLRRLNWSSARKQWPWLLLPAMLAAGWLLRRSRVSLEERLLARYRKVIQRRFGLTLDKDCRGLYALAKRLRHPLCDEFARSYGSAIYRDRPLTAAERRRLDEIIRQLRRGRS